MPIFTKRIYEGSSPDDGFRLLVMRRWPRGIRKSAVHHWEKELGPSDGLLDAYRSGAVPWDEYTRRYRVEVAQKPALLAQVRQQAQHGPVTLLCSCQDETRCHRMLLKEMLDSP